VMRGGGRWEAAFVFALTYFAKFRQNFLVAEIVVL
jgi:hypothetical protein